ncbi:MAG: hypothetical protein IKG69_11795 [Atopobiaceae bacterium]|nr:hypothetical protein [Atopobiaceae bacterium]
MASLDLPTILDTGMDDDQWFEIIDALGDEIQTHGINEAGDGTNERGEVCRQILDMMADAEE